MVKLTLTICLAAYFRVFLSERPSYYILVNIKLESGKGLLLCHRKFWLLAFVYAQARDCAPALHHWWCCMGVQYSNTSRTNFTVNSIKCNTLSYSLIWNNKAYCNKHCLSISLSIPTYTCFVFSCRMSYRIHWFGNSNSIVSLSELCRVWSKLDALLSYTFVLFIISWVCSDFWSVCLYPRGDRIHLTAKWEYQRFSL